MFGIPGAMNLGSRPTPNDDDRLWDWVLGLASAELIGELEATLIAAAKAEGK
jgi:hypothetical protein